MAFAAPLGAGVLAALAILLACVEPDGRSGALPLLSRRLVRLLRGAVSALSRTAPAEALVSSRAASVAVEDLRAHLARAGLALAPAEAASMLIVMGAGACLAGIILAGSPWGALVGAGVFSLGVAAYSSRIRRARAQALSAEMPDVFRSLAVSLGSGLTLSQAIAYVGSREHSAAAPAFARCSLMLLCGDPYEEALSTLGESLQIPGIGLLTSTLAISHQTGSPLNALFMRSAQLVERAGELERLLAVKTAQVRLSVRIVCLLPALLVGVLLLISPDFQKGVATPTGLVSLGLALCMDVAAVLIVRRLAKGIL